MKFTRSGVLGYVLPVLAIIALAILLTVTLFRLSGIQRAMHNNVSSNMVWVIYQTHIESLLLGDAVQHRLIDSSAPTENIVHRFQMLSSRISILKDGPQKRALQAMGMADTLAEKAEVLLSLGETVEDNRDLENYMQLRDVIDEFSALLFTASNKAMVAQWEEAGTRIDTYRNAVLTIFFLMIGIWVSSATISIQLLLTLKKTRDNEQVKQREIELQKQLESERKISELYRSFGSMVSHQFRTPLAVIDAAMQRLIRGGSRMETEEVVRRANQAREATQRLTFLIEHILQADRFMEQLEVSIATYSLTHLARQAVADKEMFAPGREIQFKDDTQGASLVQCDPILISQIIGNLLSNAVKYSKEDTPILVRVYCEARWVCCAVRDEGRGISPNDMPHIFKRYFRAWAATDVVGTGIGLHIAAELASLQHVEVRAFSELGVGSTFVLCLPKSDAGGVAWI